MLSIQKSPLPSGALLSRYAKDGAYTDCYTTEVNGSISNADYITAFYTTWLFKLERTILKWVVSKPSTDAQAREFGKGATDTFAAWRVEARGDNQILLCDFHGRTRSWLMVGAAIAGQPARTRLYFGSAVLLVERGRSGGSSLGPVFHALILFHKVYSVLLLYAAKSRLESYREA